MVWYGRDSFGRNMMQPRVCQRVFKTAFSKWCFLKVFSGVKTPANTALGALGLVWRPTGCSTRLLRFLALLLPAAANLVKVSTLTQGGWKKVTMSADGAKIAATTNDSGSYGKVWVSTDGGIWAWIYLMVVSDGGMDLFDAHGHQKLRISKQGPTKAVVHVRLRYQFCHDNERCFGCGDVQGWFQDGIDHHGNRRQNLAESRGWTKPTSEFSDVQDLFFVNACTCSVQIVAKVVSSWNWGSDDGATWAESGSASLTWQAMALSNDGSKMAAAVKDGNIFISDLAMCFS